MDYRKYGNIMLLRIDRGEEVIQCLTDAGNKENIRLAQVSAVGAADSLTIGLFDTRTKKYTTVDLNGENEITAMEGTITRMDGKIYLHLHITVSDEEFHAFGGHLNRAVISGTCEVVMHLIDGEVNRKFDNGVGLNLIDFTGK